MGGETEREANDAADEVSQRAATMDSAKHGRRRRAKQRNREIAGQSAGLAASDSVALWKGLEKCTE